MKHRCGLEKKKCRNKSGCCRRCDHYEACKSSSRCDNMPEVCGMYYTTVGERATKEEMKAFNFMNLRKGVKA